MKKTIYPYAVLSATGVFSHLSVQSYKSDEYVSLEHGHMAVNLDPIEIDVEMPSEGVFREKALTLLRANREKLRAEHTALMTRYQFLENQLLGLAAPELVEGERRSYATEGEVEDAEVKLQGGKHVWPEDDDDIPEEGGKC